MISRQRFPEVYGIRDDLASHANYSRKINWVIGTWKIMVSIGGIKNGTYSASLVNQICCKPARALHL